MTYNFLPSISPCMQTCRNPWPRILADEEQLIRRRRALPTEGETTRVIRFVHADDGGEFH
ncbi:hypothetical protein E2562_002906 [Oryza meyeriana var. granulata]|uniref:Uncharacterized protein n=1 Tax=Oryza meyeriana var. granulata TaxID=110450 RepID=A0A6G1DDF4_9ORYZ|nr:hypothetical protein E2562_002906 [Oryza meyeriana var. granulata]